MTTDQARHIYTKEESEGVVNVDTMKQEIEDEKLTGEKDDNVTPYQKIVTNSTQEMVIFNPKEMLGILDLRSVGYYKIRQGILQ